ncbi:reverse transcriptase domain-containing protein [Tanacetum coccineum]
MKEVHYLSWLSNPVMVKKHDRSWQMCVDFKYLNKACPKDGYPLPEIDWKVESLCGYLFKYFLYAYKGYHQIKMAKEDEEKTAFITSQGIFCYSKMSFGLKNVGATYQRLVDKAFQKQIRRNLEVYVDDLDGMFLVYKVNADGLKVCPDKADAVLSLPSSGFLKDVQKLNEKLVSLNRFMSKSAERSLHFFKTLKKCTKKSDFQWTQEAEVAFRQIKKLITKLRMLTEPNEREELIMYLAAAKEAISTVLMIEREGKQMPMYFVSRALRGFEINYTPMEKLLLALLRASRQLKRYFQSHTIFVITDQPIKQLLSNSEITGRMLKFEATNNEAEYEALIAGLRIAEQMGVKKPSSKRRLTACSQPVPRSENKKANALSKIASTSFAHLSKQLLVKELKEKSLNEKEVLAIVEEEGHTWMTPICEYLTKEILLEDKKKARVVRRKASKYAVINGTLYKKSFLGPWLRCVEPLQANYVLREIHEGSCSMHSGPRSMVAKAIRTGYYWPTMHTDVRKLIRECNNCQVHRPIPRNPQQNLNPITSPWPFYKWGIEIAGPFLEGPGKVKFLIVANDYFTKRIEAKPVATITDNQVKKFV